MKKTVYLIGQKYELELEDGFFDFIKNKLDKLDTSDNQVKTLLNLFLSSEYELYEKNKSLKQMIEQLEEKIK